MGIAEAQLEEGEKYTDLPASLEWEAGDGHPVDSTSWSWSHAWLVLKAFTRAGATSRELDDKALAHELRSI